MSSSSNLFARHFSLRDKRSSQQRVSTLALFRRSSTNKLMSSEKASPTAADQYGLFLVDEDAAKKPSKDEERKIQELLQLFASRGRSNVPTARILYALRAKGVGGDSAKAWELLLLFEDSAAGVLRPFSPQQRITGADNRQKVTCWLDALLFAMFFKPTVFEALLYHEYTDDPRRRLVAVLRLWVNLLRSGKLITIDVTRHLQEAMCACGWNEAAMLKQQDASEAFVFLTDKLELPLLTLKTDLFHSGREDNDDHKFITERLLDVAIPDDAPKDGVVSLERCLEEYFNNKVEVKRDLRRQPTLKPGGTDESQSGIHVEYAEVSGEESNPSTPRMSREPSMQTGRPTFTRQRQPSIFSDRKVEIIDGLEKVGTDDTGKPKLRPRGSSIRKEVLMPAWQFLNLIPWYTDQSSHVNSQIKSHFSSKRPMLGICLKRYTVNKDGHPSRLNTKIDIPLAMIPPHFAIGDNESGDITSNTGLKLSLQAVVCHRGNHVTSGHYIALVRAGPRRGGSRESVRNESPADCEDGSQDVWYRHDDLPAEHKVTEVNIKAALEHEWPYLLFYQVLPLDSDEPSDDPPPYQESETASLIGEKLAALPAQGRPSTEVTDWSRRPSVAMSEEPRGRPSQTMDAPRGLGVDSGSLAAPRSEQPSTAGSTAATTPADEPQGNPLATAAKPPSKSSKSSRQGSEASDNVFNRITSRLSRDKLGAPETVIVTDEVAVDDKSAERPSKDGARITLPNSVSSSKSRDRRNKLKSSMSRRGSLARRTKGKEIDRECTIM